MTDPTPTNRSLALSDGFIATDRLCGPVLQCPALAATADHLFTTRTLRFRGPRERDEWALVARALGVADARFYRPQQVHGRAVVVVRREEPATAWSGEGPPADIVISDDPDAAVAVQVADCIPLLAADRRTGAVAAAHAGWRGSVSDVAGTMVRAMADAFGTRAPDLEVALGPSIGPCCYVVGPELREAFQAASVHGAGAARFFRPAMRTVAAGDAADRLLLDLWRVNYEQLLAAGVGPASIHLSRLCTVNHRNRFFSYRVEGAGTGRIVAAIRPGPAVRFHAPARRPR